MKVFEATLSQPIPAAPRPRMAPAGHAYTPPTYRKQLAALRDEIARIAKRRHHRIIPADCEVVVWMWLDKPRRPADIDNRAKTILDALSGIVYEDDRQVVILHVDQTGVEKPQVAVFRREKERE